MTSVINKGMKENVIGKAGCHLLHTSFRPLVYKKYNIYERFNLRSVNDISSWVEKTINIK